MCEGKDFSLPAEEQRVLELWARLDVFHEQLHRTEGGEEFIFYDGPPFATGLPHYGHILAGTIKDVVTRHQSMRGRHVMRRFGWDCHGLPVEFEIDKLIGITNRQQVLDLGIGNCNETCIVTKYVTEWEVVVTRTGRWIDFKARPWTSTSWRASDGSSASSVTRTPSTRASSPWHRRRRSQLRMICWCEQQLDKKELEQKLKKDQKAREKEEKKQKASQRETARLQVLLWCA